MTEPRTLHETHEPLSIAAYAAGDLDGIEQDEASRLVAECQACARLHADLLALATATRDLPIPIRTRDFTLTGDDAARLRRRSWRGALAALAGPRYSLARPLGAALTSLGLAGLLLASLPGGFSFGGQAAMPATVDRSYSAQPAAAPEVDPLGGERLNSTGASAAPIGQAPGAGDAQGDPGTGQAGGGTDTAAAAEARDGGLLQRPADATLVIVSGSFLIVGLGLFGLRWAARRLGDG